MSTPQTGLEMLVSKEPVVATHMGIFAPEVAATTYTRYYIETQTFVSTPTIQKYTQTLIETIRADRTAIACLVAPFGYGKTSTVIYLWQACGEANLLAIPPFSCNSVAEMGQAIASALVYRFGQDGFSAAVKAVQAAYDSYLVSSAQRLAEQDSERYAIDYNTALRSIEDKIESGHLNVEANGTNLLRFLEQVTEISVEAGYSGLVVLVDEFQQFLGNINKAIITSFRTLIWGLRTRGDLPLGFVMTMDPDTERNLTDRGADILHRIRKDGLYLAFADIYDREFPRELWSRYSETFGFLDTSRQIVDNATLEAIGQICERSDLSNGPRTVINVFQRIAAVQAIRQRSYSPLDLIDDFLSGDIKFDGDRGKISSLVNELTAYDYIKRVPARINTLKLIAAFPRGCPGEVAAFYGLDDTFAQMIDELRGEILLELPEGVALIDLQRVGKPQNKLNIILKKYWMQITEAEIIADRAKALFAEYGISPLFPPYISINEGWHSLTKGWQYTENDGYFQIYEGTFFSEYPHRRLAVQVCSAPRDAVIPHDVDAHFVFIIQTENSGDLTVPKYLLEPQTFLFPIFIHRPFERKLPRDIRDIEDYLSPVVLTPGVLVSLLDYIHQQIPLIEGMSEQERERIEDKQNKLQEFLLVMIFGEALFESYGIQIFSRGTQAVRDVLFQIFRSAYPSYKTLITAPTWRGTLDTYRQVLAQIDTAQRRGIDILSEKKSALAGAFNQRSHAGFDSYARQFEGLMRIVDWRGDTGELEFTKHPAENLLIEIISAAQEIPTTQIYAEARRYGYLPDEVQYLLAFLELRGYIETVDQGEHYRPAHTLSTVELRTILEDVRRESHLLAHHLRDDNVREVQHRVDNLERLLVNDQTDLADAQVKIIQLQRETRRRRPELIEAVYRHLHQQRDQLYTAIGLLNKPVPESDTGLPLDKHINGASRMITKNLQPMIKRLETLRADVVQATNQGFDTDNAAINELERFVEGLHGIASRIDSVLSEVNQRAALLALQGKWVFLIDRIRRLDDSLAVAAQVTDVTLLGQYLENTILALQQELATRGLEDYQAIYDTFNPQFDTLQHDLALAVNLAEHTRQAPSKPQVPDVQSQSPKHNRTHSMSESEQVHAALHNARGDLRAAFKHSQLSAQQFLEWLFELQKGGVLNIQITADIDED